jgi:tellurite resistance protein
MRRLIGPGQVLADWRDPVLAPFVPVVAIPPMILASALSTVAFTAGRILVVVSLAVTIVLGGLMTGQWIVGDLVRDSAHPGYFLPTVTGGFIGAYAAGLVHLHPVAETSCSIGAICWPLLNSIVLGRLFSRPALPPPLTPTLAIELAPPVVAGIGYFAITGGRIDFIARALAG